MSNVSDQDKNLQAEISAFWDGQAEKLGAGGQPHHNVWDDDHRRVWLDALRPVLPPPPVDILDVGTGTGYLALLLAELGHRVTGIDLSEGMLGSGRLIAAERERAGAAPYPPTFTIGEAMNPAFPPASFDVVSNRNVLWTMLDPRIAFRNWMTLLRPGGQVLAVHHWTMQGKTTYSDDLRTAMLEKVGLQPGQTRLEASFNDILKALLAEAGFTDIRITEFKDVDRYESEHGSTHLGWLALTALKPQSSSL